MVYHYITDSQMLEAVLTKPTV